MFSREIDLHPFVLLLNLFLTTLLKKGKWQKVHCLSFLAVSWPRFRIDRDCLELVNIHVSNSPLYIDNADYNCIRIFRSALFPDFFL